MPHRNLSVRRFRNFLLLAGLAAVAACGGGNGQFSGPGIGPDGGTVTSDDNLVIVTIPAGVLPSGREVSIVPITAALAEPALGGLPPGTTFYEVVGLDDLSGPVLVAFNGIDSQVTSAGTKQGLVIPVVLGGGRALPYVPTEITVAVFDDAGDAELRHGIEGGVVQIAYLPPEASGLCATALIPDVIQVGQSDLITLQLDQDAASLIDTAGSGAAWRTIAETSAPCVAMDSKPTIFAGGQALVASLAQTLVDQRQVTATAEGSDSISVVITIPAFEAAAAFPMLDIAFSLTSVTFEFGDVTECIGGGPATPLVFPLVQYTAPEAMRLIPGFPFASTPSGAPAIVVAATGGVEFFDPGSGTNLGSSPLSFSTYFDAAFIPPPASSPGLDPALFGSGVGYGLTIVDPLTGIQSGLVQIGGIPFLASDIDFAGGDPANGILVVDSTNHVIRLAAYDPTTDYYSVNGLVSNQGPGGAEFFSAVSEATATRLLVIDKSPGPTNPDQLLFIDRATNPPTSIVVGPLGFDSRRIRWDPSSGRAAVSNRVSNSITILDWDGIGLPSITDTALVAAEPIGLDVFGNVIAVSGFGDDQLSIVTTNGAGVVATIATAPLPIAIDQPGHTLFLRDANHSIVVSGNGSDNIAYIPFAY